MTDKSDSTFRILCLDKDPTFLRMLQINLERYGIDVVTASHGIDGFMQYKAYEGIFDAILSDNDMPQIDGLGFIRTVREMGFQGQIVLMSGNLRPEQLQECMGLAVSGFFHKPFEVSLLAAMLLGSDF